MWNISILNYKIKEEEKNCLSKKRREVTSLQNNNARFDSLCFFFFLNHKKNDCTPKFDPQKEHFMEVEVRKERRYDLNNIHHFEYDT